MPERQKDVPQVYDEGWSARGSESSWVNASAIGEKCSYGSDVTAGLQEAQNETHLTRQHKPWIKWNSYAAYIYNVESPDAWATDEIATAPWTRRRHPLSPDRRSSAVL